MFGDADGPALRAPVRRRPQIVTAPAAAAGTVVLNGTPIPEHDQGWHADENRCGKPSGHHGPMCDRQRLIVGAVRPDGSASVELTEMNAASVGRGLDPKDLRDRLEFVTVSTAVLTASHGLDDGLTAGQYRKLLMQDVEPPARLDENVPAVKLSVRRVDSDVIQTLETTG